MNKSKLYLLLRKIGSLEKGTSDAEGFHVITHELKFLKSVVGAVNCGCHNSGCSGTTNDACHNESCSGGSNYGCSNQ